jgi:hypothetical protein
MKDVLMALVPHVSKRVGDIMCAWCGQLVEIFLCQIDLYSLPNIIRVIRSKRSRWAGHVVHNGEEDKCCSVVVGKLQGKRSQT